MQSTFESLLIII